MNILGVTSLFYFDSFCSTCTTVLNMHNPCRLRWTRWAQFCRGLDSVLIWMSWGRFDTLGGFSWQDSWLNSFLLSSHWDLLITAVLIWWVVIFIFHWVFSWVVGHERFLYNVWLHHNRLSFRLIRHVAVRRTIPCVLILGSSSLGDDNASFSRLTLARLVFATNCASAGSVARCSDLVELNFSIVDLSSDWWSLSYCRNSGFSFLTNELNLLFLSQRYLTWLKRLDIELFGLHFQIARFKGEDLDVLSLLSWALVCGHEHVTLLGGVVSHTRWIAAYSISWGSPARPIWI